MTPLWDDFVGAIGEENAAQARRVLEGSGIPLGRFGTPEEAGALVAFLLSEDASYVSGDILPLAGGANADNFVRQVGSRLRPGLSPPRRAGGALTGPLPSGYCPRGFVRPTRSGLVERDLCSDLRNVQRPRSAGLRPTADSSLVASRRRRTMRPASITRSPGGDSRSSPSPWPLWSAAVVTAVATASTKKSHALPPAQVLNYRPTSAGTARRTRSCRRSPSAGSTARAVRPTSTSRSRRASSRRACRW